ncbi:unnamed protein product, partial [Hymenolepis diminuta]
QAQTESFKAHYGTDLRALFDVAKKTIFTISIEILPKPRGNCMIFCVTDYPFVYPSWAVEIDGRHLNDTCFQIRAQTVLKAFICCAFAVTKCFGIEMPPPIIRLDSQFYENLNSELPGDTVVSLFF